MGVPSFKTVVEPLINSVPGGLDEITTSTTTVEPKKILGLCYFYEFALWTFWNEP